jgi:L,D-transpeptidase ErfK/SrfK
MRGNCLKSQLQQIFAATLLGLCPALTAQAATYVLPKGDVVGQIQYANVNANETLSTIARRYDVGFNAIKAANPHVDPERPAAGARIIIPSRHILPPGPREGIVINVAEMRLYYYSAPSEGPALVSTYPIGIGSEGLAVRAGTYKIEQRLSRPSWTLPASVKTREPKVVPPGPNNPLGAYTITLDAAGAMIHGTNQPNTIGTKGGRGSMRMYPEDIELLIHRVTMGTQVRIINQPLKHGYKSGALYLEFHKPDSAKGELNHAALVNWMSGIVKAPLDSADWQRVRLVAEGSHSVAMPVVQMKSKPRPERAWWLQLNSYKTAQAAHALINKVEALGVPLSIKGCHDNQPCKVVAGPFKDKTYIDDLRKKIKWVTGVKGNVVPYQEEDDFQLPQLKLKVALAD